MVNVRTGTGAPTPTAADRTAGSATPSLDREDSIGSTSTSSNYNSTAFNKNQPLSKSNSVLSHKSIPFTGAYPIGHLKVVQPAEPICEGGETIGDEGSTAVSDSGGTTRGSSRISGTTTGDPPASTGHPSKGDVFVLLSIPFESQVGCDVMALTVKKTAATTMTGGNDGDNDALLGFRDLPPGTHFVWLSAPGAMSRQGYWFVTQPEPSGAVRVKQWDRFNEVLGESASQYEARSLTDNIAAVSPRLVSYNSAGHSATTSPGQPTTTPTPLRQPYPGPPPRDSETVVHEDRIWSSLTSCINETVLGRITGRKAATTTGGKVQRGAVVAAATAGPTSAVTHTEWMVSTTDTAKGEIAMPRAAPSQLWAGFAEFTFLFAKDDLDPFHLIASRDKSKLRNSGPATPALSSELGGSGANRSERRTGASDTTDRIIAVLEHSFPSPDDSTTVTHLDDNDLIGELQFVFLTGTLLSNLSCLEQWWHLVLKIFLRAQGLVSRRPSLCRSFIQTLHSQFSYLERYVSGGFLGYTLARTAGQSITTVDADAGGAGIFEAKPQGAARLQASLTDFKRHLNETLLGLGKAASPEEAAVGEAFASLEASLWKYGWDLRSDYAADNGGNNSTEYDDNRGGRFGDPADNDDADGEMDYYEEAIKQTTGSGEKSHRKHHTGLSDTDSDSDQPVLVDLDADGREVGLLSWD
ncbi:aar2 domain containing protein [Sporothrix brasiliensis 5110]|uniref:Aar2 domain containing protein n=1 Tax=Sporothrix brasiliensis 5110 TaxID=1398154 RepID=A0A0C2F1E3_9PEZI|nr:aar2 domain containing protein [Sporothrix brasiliensis 5110]KIH92704.1 aar2 domain containing protein [Sporothrix brasiliensis 5110]